MSDRYLVEETETEWDIPYWSLVAAGAVGGVVGLFLFIALLTLVGAVL